MCCRFFRYRRSPKRKSHNPFLKLYFPEKEIFHPEIMMVQFSLVSYENPPTVHPLQSHQGKISDLGLGDTFRFFFIKSN